MRRLFFALLASVVPAAVSVAQSARPARCAPDNGGITLPKGFCATIFADSLAQPRHITVAPNGDVFVALQGGGVMALRDRNGDGVADERNKFGDFHGSEVVLFDGYLYVENTTDIMRYRLPAGALSPVGEPETVVKGLPPKGHAAKTFTIAADGSLFVNVGSGTNACQRDDLIGDLLGRT